MEHTWRSDHLPKLEVSNLEAGDVAVCGAFASRDPILGKLDPHRVAFAAPLGSRSDLECLLRGLHLHPNVRHLVVCGDDVEIAAQALLALWRDGLDESGRLPGSRGRLSAELDATSVDALRNDVKLWDWRGKPPSELAAGVLELPALQQKREPRPLSDPAIPERKVFLSRKTSFPIFGNDVGDSWLQLLNLALRVGTEKQTEAGERLAEVLNPVVTIGLPVIAEDLEVDVDAPEDFPSCLDFNADDFEHHCRRLEIEAVCDRVESSLDARDATAFFLEPGDLGSPKLAAHAIAASFNVVDRCLFGSFVLRETDLYSDWPLEAMALMRVQRELAARLELELGAATFIIHSARLRERDWGRAAHVLDEFFKRPLPLQVDHSGIFLFGNDGGEARAMLLDHDAGTIFWEEAFSSAEQLSWYIVDAMPWLLPQHIRYVGQECSTLKRAIEEGACYEQG